MFTKLKRPTCSASIVLLSCGSFSPITMMHMRMMEMAREACEMEVLGGLLSPVNDAYGKMGLASAHHRLEMIKKACSHSDWLEGWGWEAEQAEWVPTAAVLRQLSRMVPAGIQVGLVAGSDLLKSLAVDGLWSQDDLEFIFGNHEIFLVDRPDACVNVDALVLELDVLFKHRHRIHFIHQPIQNNISSTRIRLLVKRGKSIAFLVDPSVAKYIHSNCLYK